MSRKESRLARQYARISSDNTSSSDVVVVEDAQSELRRRSTRTRPIWASLLQHGIATHHEFWTTAIDNRVSAVVHCKVSKHSLHRDEIAGCSEKVYDSLTLADAKKILIFASDQELQAYVLDDHPDWEIRGVLEKAKELAPCKEIPSLQLINQTLGYARELERIV